MRRRKKIYQEESGLDLTPMLDIVFIMLIFFIVTTSFVKESGIEVNRPNVSIANIKLSSPTKFGISGENLFVPLPISFDHIFSSLFFGPER